MNRGEGGRCSQVVVENKELFSLVLHQVLAEVVDEESDVGRAAILV